jgi:hypothetical protein
MKDMNSKVFILHEQIDRDRSSALKYGRLCPVFAQGSRPSANVMSSVEIIKDVFKDFDPAQDYLVWVGGDQLVLLLVGAYLSSRQHSRVQWLSWNRERDDQGVRNPTKGYYIPRKIEFSNLFN